MAMHLCGMGRRLMWIAVAVLLGAAGGYAWWHWYGCTNGCLITSVWWRSTLYGAVLGYLALGLVWPDKPKAGA
ncbi:MAG: hypothetical protein GFGODING_02776 [Flavobacteriales bacterium]|nr:hypothetical protein [Flavobacteriales bacterium]